MKTLPGIVTTMFPHSLSITMVTCFLAFLLFWAAASGCGCGDVEPARPPFNPEKPYNHEDILRFLRAAPALYGEITRYKRLLGDGDSIEKLSLLDKHAANYGYSRYSDFAVAYTRFTNAVTRIRMLANNGDVDTIKVGEGLDGILKDDIRLVIPYLDDIERVVKEAGAAAGAERESSTDPGVPDLLGPGVSGRFERK